MESTDLLTLPQLAQRLQVSEKAARALYRRKRIPGIKVSYRTLRFSWPDVVDSLRKQQAEAAQVPTAE